MTEQVAKLMGNLLAGGEGIFLPDVGSLYVERQPARRIDRRHVVPPCRRVEFSSQERGVSLVDEIARVLRVNGVKPEDPAPEAQKVYDRWLALVREENTLTIVGVGVLRFKEFKPDEAFDRRLNPQGHEPVRVRTPRRFDAVLWIGIAAILCVSVGTAWWWFGGRDQRQEMHAAVSAPAVAAETGPETVADGPSVESSAPEGAAEGGSAVGALPEAAPGATAEGAGTAPGAAQPVAGTAAGAGISNDVAQTESARSGESSAAGTRGSSDSGLARMTSGRHYVVMGVFSSEQNARRAAQEASSKEVAMACGVYRFGSKFMVSPFESDDPEACRLFIRAHAERFPGMWTYTAR